MTYDGRRKLFFILLTLFIASLIVFDLSHNVIYNNLMNLILLSVFGFIFLLDKELHLRFNSFILAYLLFTSFALSSIFWAVDFDLALSYSLRLVVAFINIWMVYTIISHYKIHNAILYGILIGAFFNYLIAFGIIHVNYEIYEFGRFLGTEGNSNKLAKVMLLTIFASIVLLSLDTTNKYLKVYLRFSILLSLYVIFLTVSKKAIILAPILLLSTISFKEVKLKNIVISFLTVAVLIKIFFTYMDFNYLNSVLDIFEKRFAGLFHILEGGRGDASSGERAYLIKEGFNIFMDNPVFGTGLNTFRVFLGKYAHNNYLELLVDVGMIGFVLFYAIYGIVFLEIKKMNKSKLRRYMLIMVIILLLMDLATVSYFNKLILLVLLYIYFVAKNNQKEQSL